jgi:hypothetical protein
MAATLVPYAAVSDDDSQADIDTCCESGEKIPGAPFEEDCCPNGCHGCLLRCCAGKVVAHISSVVLDSNLPSLKSVASFQDSFSTANLDEIYHPPRS